MKVLHIFNELRYSGAEIMYANAVPLFHQAGVEMIVLSSGHQKGEFASQFEEKGVKVIHMSLPDFTKNPVFLFKYFKSFYQYLHEERIDIIHIHRATYFWFFSFAGWLRGKKIIRTVHNVFKNRKITWLKAFLERYTARKIFGVVFQTIGESVYQNELHYYKNISVRVNNWYNNKKFYPSSSDEEKYIIRNRLKIPHDSFVILSSGSCTHIKNHHDIIRALVEINKKISCLYIHLGKGETEDEEKQMAKSHAIEKQIMFLGNQDNVRDYLIAADIYIMSSRFEGLSIASIEAMGCAIPSILYNSPGLRDLIRNDDNGFLVNPEHEMIAEKTLILSTQPELAKEMGLNAYQHVVKNYSMESGVKGIVALYAGESGN